MKVRVDEWEMDDYDGQFSPMAFGPMGSMVLNRAGGTDDIEIQADDHNAPVMFAPLEAVRVFVGMCDAWVAKRRDRT